MVITSAATVFPVSDLETSLAFYIEKLGFSQAFRVDQYAGLSRDNCLLHLSESNDPDRPLPGSGIVYLFCDDVDAIYAELTTREINVVCDIKTYEYGMRDFVIADHDGNQTSFGMPVD